MDSGPARTHHLLQRLDPINRHLRGRSQSDLASSDYFQYRRVLLPKRFALLMVSCKRMNVDESLLYKGLFSAILQSSARSIALPIDQLKFSYHVLDNITEQPLTVNLSVCRC